MRRMTTCAMAGLLMLAMIGVATPARVGAQPVLKCDFEDATAFLTSPGTLIGTPGDDVLVGSPGADIIKGLGGDDRICGEPDGATLGGVDALSGGAGKDALRGGPGDDIIAGDAGDDFLTGGEGNDRLRGGSGGDLLEDYRGNNDADGGQGRDRVDVSGTARGGSGDDGTVSASGDDFASSDCFCTPYASGGSGSDTFVAVFGAGGIADGGSGNDGPDFGRVYGGSGAVELRGGSGNDQLSASDDNLILNGGAGYDRCEAKGFANLTFVSCEVQLP